MTQEFDETEQPQEQPPRWFYPDLRCTLEEIRRCFIIQAFPDDDVDGWMDTEHYLLTGKQRREPPKGDKVVQLKTPRD